MRIFSVVCLLCVRLLLCAQELVYIEDIVTEGNRKTRTEILLRELRFGVGDTIPLTLLDTFCLESEQLLLNTSLFNKVQIAPVQCLDCPTAARRIRVVVEEAWYLYPIPIFELADRNFNVWWVDQNRSMQRINFGTEFAHINITGRGDRLKVGAKYGYTHNYAFRYSLPYINKKQTIGISTDVSFARNRELNYATDGDKQLFYRDEDGEFVYSRFRTTLGLTWRPGLRTFHYFNAGYFQNRISDFIASELNPKFFLDGRNLQRYVSLSYEFVYDGRDVRPYPLNGKYLSLRLVRDGVDNFGDRDALTLHAYYDQYFSFSPRWSLGLRSGAKASFVRCPQPYNDNRAMGFGRNTLHGYEYYIMDGLDMGFLKSNLRFLLLKNEIEFGKLVPISQFRNMPVKIYFSVNSDWGYVNDPFLRRNNNLVNQPLWGGGIGLDFVLFFDKVIQVEYSMNYLLEKGLFLHINMNL